MPHIFLTTLQEHLKAGHIDRRQFMKRAAALGFSAPIIAAALAACGGDDDDDDDTDGDASSGDATAADAAEPTATEAGGVTVNQNVTATPSEEADDAGATEEATDEEEQAEPTEATGSTGSAGGSVTFSRQTDSDNMDPVTNDGNINIWVFMSIYDQLIKVGENGTDLVPGLAEEWDVTEDGLTYTFTIRSGVKFFDGTDMTVDDIVWSLDRARTNAESIWTFSLEPVELIEAADDSTVVITLRENWAPFLADIAMFNASVISQAFAEEVGEESLVDQTMGTGPFHMQEWAKEERMTLVKNPNYWESGLPLLDEIVLTVVPDGNSQVLQLQGGEINGIIGQGDVAFNRVSELDQDENLQIIISTSTWNNFVVLNTREAPLNDVSVRQALNYATNKEAIIETVLFGNAEFSNSYMPRGALYWNPDQPGYPYDVEQAKTLMAESASPDGFDLEFQIASGDQLQLQIATALKDMWSAIGVNLNIAQLEAGVLSDNYRNNQFQARHTGWTNDIIDPDQLASYAILPEQTENYHTGWTNQEAIDLALEARVTLDPEQRREMYYRVQEIHMNDAPFVYLYTLPYVDALTANVVSYVHHPMGHYIWKNMSVEE